MRLTHHEQADIAYARIAAKKENSDRYYLELISETNSDAQIQTVSISRKELNRYQINQGDIFLIHIAANNQNNTEYFAKILDTPPKGEAARITGIYSDNRLGRFFIPDNNGIKTEFKISKEYAEEQSLAHRQNYWATIPLDFNRSTPSVEIMPQQNIEPSMGVPISDILISKNNIRETHTHKSITEAPYLAKKPINIKSRMDLTHMNFITVDPEGATDLDDAIFCEKTCDGLRLMVAIADVSFYVPYNSEIDKEARQRGTSHYFPDKVVFMLPNELTQKCSLNSTNKPAMVFELLYNHQGQIESFAPIQAVISPKANLTYEQYDQMCLDNSPITTNIAEFMNELHNLSTFKASALIHKNETLFDPDPSHYIGSTHIETAMVQANYAVSKMITESGVPSLHRNNSPILEPVFYAKTRNILRQLQIDIPKSPLECTQEHIALALEKARFKGIFNNVSQLIQTQFLGRAHYDPQATGHFSLKLPFYTHATSPIRRYADIVVARSVRSIMGWNGGLSDKEIEDLPSLAAHLNEMNWQSKQMVRDYKKFQALGDLERLKNHSLRATVLYVNPQDQSAEILLPKQGLRKRLTKPQLAKQGYHIDKRSCCLIFTEASSQETYSYEQFNDIHCHLTNISPAHGRWEIELEPPKELAKLNQNELHIANG